MVPEAKGPTLHTRRYLSWLGKVKLQPSLASEFAYAVLSGFAGELRRVPHDNRVRSTFQRACNLGREGELGDWRLPHLHVDLLQLAVLCRDRVAVGLLLSLDRFRTAKYGERSGVDGVPVVENHPVSLACVFGADLDCLQPMLDAGSEVLWSEGVVTLQRTPFPSLIAPAGRRQGLEIWGSPTQLAFRSRNLSALQSILRRAFLALPNAERGLLGDGSLFFLWETLSMAHDPLLRPSVFPTVLDLTGSVHDDVLILFCQRLAAEHWVASEECAIGCLPVPACFLQCASSLSGFFTEAQLHSASAIVRSQLKILEGVAFSCKSVCHRHRQNEQLRACSQEDLASLLRDFDGGKRERTLQTRSIQTVLKRLEGDSRRTESMAMPGGLRRHFCVPFRFVLDRFLQGLP